MAPFKLKFRMGSSRSTSQDTDNSDHSTVGGSGNATATASVTHHCHQHHHHHQHHAGSGNANDAQLQPLLQSHQFHNNNRSPNHSSGTLSLAESNTTLDSTAYSSSGSLNGNGEQRQLLPAALLSNSANSAPGQRNRSGYTNPVVVDNLNEIIANVPQSPPPSYEYVLEENRLANLDKDNNPTYGPSRPRSSASVHVVENGLANCLNEQRFTAADIRNNSSTSVGGSTVDRELNVAFRFGSMTTPSQEDLLGNLDGSCDPLFINENAAVNDDEQPHPTNDNDSIKTHTACGSSSSATSTLRKRGDSNTTTNTTASVQNADTGGGPADDCAARGGNIGAGGSSSRAHANNNEGSFSDSEIENYTDTDNDDNNDDDWNSHHEQYQQQQQQQQQNEMAQTPDTIINNKSSKEIYKAVAKQWGITCKMSEQCRCMECQSNYFDCEYEENDQQVREGVCNVDGGLGAGAPMFISDVMHGTTCNIL